MSVSQEKRPGGKMATATPTGPAASSRPGTPAAAATGPVHSDDDRIMADLVEKAVGSRVRITTTVSTDEPIEGILYTACPVTQVVAVQVSGQAGAPPSSPSFGGDFRIVPVTAIDGLVVLARPGSNERIGVGLGPAAFTVSNDRLDQLKAREEAAVRKLKMQEATRGVGVSRDGQDVFDALHRTLPARWQGQTIVVNDAVIIKPPYRLEDAHVEKGKEASLVQVRKIMELWLTRKKAGSSPAQVNLAHQGLSPSGGVGLSPSMSPSQTPATSVPVLPLKGG